MSSMIATLHWLWSALTQPQPAELAALPDPQARADSAALLSVAALAVLLLLGLVFIRPQVPRYTPGPLGLILTIVSASDVAVLAADLGLPAPPAGPGLPLLFDVDGHRGSKRLLLAEAAEPINEEVP